MGIDVDLYRESIGKYYTACNLFISGQQSDVFTFLVYFLVSAALQKKCTSIHNGVILVPYNKSRLQQATSVMFNSLPLFTERATAFLFLNVSISSLFFAFC
jgi:hypothetical protein